MFDSGSCVNLDPTNISYRPVAVRMSRQDGLTSLLTQDVVPPEASQSLRTFGWFDEACIARLLDENAREQMAKVVQVNFVELAASQGR